MKKVKKLELNKETIRKLDDADLRRVAGGLVVVTVVACPTPTQPPFCDCLGTSLPAPTYTCGPTDNCM